mgnify:CR=1 FL=1
MLSAAHDILAPSTTNSNETTLHTNNTLDCNTVSTGVCDIWYWEKIDRGMWLI